MIKKSNYLFVFLLIISLTECNSQTKKIDTLEFQIGYPYVKTDALDQLKNYPSPRYKPNNNFIRIYNWMSPYYAGGAEQEGVSIPDAIKKATDIQEELGMNWNYNLVISNPRITPNEAALKDPNSPFTSFIDLANKHPEIPLGVTVFWMQMKPSAFGNKNTQPNILRQDFPENFYLKDVRINKTVRVISYAAPDSIFIGDGLVQRKQLQPLIKHLTRPINIINENGEEPPKAYTIVSLKNDSLLIYDKNNLKIESWSIYSATKKKHMRQLYSSQFMDSIPQLKNTWFTYYQIEGGPIDRYDWNASKATCSKINGNYYSTPDFYPRTPDNWRLWKGAWHGWKWINDGRKVEIKYGDRFFSPYVAAGWANNPETDIRPAQWLGLLKCLTVVGAEFFYTGYFNLKKPFSKPENYIWQAAMPSYAQAVTTHFSDIFRNGNVLFDSKGMPIITYPVDDKDVLVTIRKHNQKEQYIIAATVQPLSNTESSLLNKNIEINLDDETFIIKARRQGSVYFLDKSIRPYVFYQLDRWHQYEHPMRWRKNLIYEAEVFDTSYAIVPIKTSYETLQNKIDFTKTESSIVLSNEKWTGYNINSRDLGHFSTNVYILIYIKNNSSVSGEVLINDWKKKFTNQKGSEWEWISVEVPKDILLKNKNSILKIKSLCENLEIDKIVITDSRLPDLLSY